MSKPNTLERETEIVNFLVWHGKQGGTLGDGAMSQIEYWRQEATGEEFTKYLNDVGFNPSDYKNGPARN